MSTDTPSIDMEGSLDSIESSIEGWDGEIEELPEGDIGGVSEKYYGEGTPNVPPRLDVPEVLAADIEITSDPSKVEEVADFWFPNETDRYSKVITVYFNDGRTWNWPLPPWDSDSERARKHFIETYVPQIIKWECIKKGEDYKPKLEEFKQNHKITEPDWESLIEETEMSEEDRKWFNNNADWIPHISRKASGDDMIDIEVDDRFGWMEEEW